MAGQEQTSSSSSTEFDSTPMLQDILSKMPNSVEKQRGTDLITGLLEGISKKFVTWDSSLTKTLLTAIDEIDQKLSEQLAEIMHHPEFQKLEGSWRGLWYFVKETKTGQDIRINVLNTTKQELHKDLTRAIDFDQSFFWKQIYENSFGQAGADPYGLLIGDFEFGNDNTDMELLSKVSGVAAAAFAPFISAAHPDLFGLESYEEITNIPDMSSLFANKTKYIKWNSFRESDDSRFAVLTLPRVLAREPYGSSNTRIEDFKFEEFPLSKDGRFSERVTHDQYTWMNCAYSYATKITKAFEQTGWCTRIRGYENGGMVEDLPTHVFRTKEGSYSQKCPSEVLIPDRREKEFSDLGFLPLVNWKDTDKSVFMGAQTCHKPKKYIGDTLSTENEQISARLPYLMASSRIAHYLKVIGREKIGSFAERDDLEDFLQRWVSAYVLNSDTATPEQKSKFPLRSAKVTVENIPGRSGAYNARVDLRPWLQLEELHASVSMVAEIAEGK